MTRPGFGRRMQQELRGMLKVSPLVLASLVLVAMLWRTDSAANSGLFQSSPVETPPPISSPTSTSESTVTITDPAPSQTPGATLTASPAETVSPTATAMATEPPPTDTPVASATSETAEPDESQRYPEEESNLKFEWGMLFDSVALFFSYIWLCCGILMFIAVPFLFFVLWRASSNRQEEGEQEEGEQEEGGQEEGGQEED